MPGYESDRFVDLSQNDKAELTCSICQDILCSPLVAQCCQQSFCEDCINDWLKNNNTCPYDRKTLTSNGLTRPPRIMLYMLGKLRINCDYKRNGCKEVLLLENLSQHIINCGYKVEKCEKCLCEIQDKSSHDCIKTLLELNRKTNEENEIIKSKSSANTIQYILREQSLLREIYQLKTEMDTLVKENGDLKISKQEIIKQARRHILTPEVIDINMKEELKCKVFSIVKEEILKEYKSGFDFCKNIKKKLDAECGGSWCCIASHRQNIKSFYTYEIGYNINIKFAELYLRIYRIQYFDVEEFVQRMKNGKIKREIKISKTDMNENMISDVKEIIFGAIEKSNSMDEISNVIREKISTKYQGNWQCILYAHFGNYSIIHILGTYIYFEVDNLEFILFQAEI